MTAIAVFGIATTTLAQVPSYVPTNGLVGYWPFNGNANDESGNGNNGTVNGATLTSDRFGSTNAAYSFNGVSNYIECIQSGPIGVPSKAHTIPLFDRIKEGDFYILFSTVTQEELENAPDQVKELVKSLKKDQTEYIDITDEAVDLATEYITEKVVGQTSYADCLHIALATITRADFLVSWNFKHIVNIERIRGYNSINIKNGYQQLEIRSPREFEKHEDDRENI